MSFETTAGSPRDQVAILRLYTLPDVGARVLGLILASRAVCADLFHRPQFIARAGSEDGNDESTPS